MPSQEVARLRTLLGSGKLVHPYLSSECFAQRLRETEAAASRSAAAAINDARDRDAPTDDETLHGDKLCDNFVDLAASLSICCGVTPPPAVASTGCAYENQFLRARAPNGDLEREISWRRLQLATEIGGTVSGKREATGILRKDAETAELEADGDDDSANYSRRHIVLILCDGMGNSVLEQHVSDKASSFFMRNNQSSRLRAVFPSTTPAALTTLATATWPGRHGMPGWNLRDKKGCDLPGSQNGGANQPVQLLVLSDHIRDARSGELASEEFGSWDDVFVEAPWARKVLSSQRKQQQVMSKPVQDDAKNSNVGTRRMVYINAYNGDDYQDWSQGKSKELEQTRKRKHSDATDFSSWFVGEGDGDRDGENSNLPSLLETAKIEETAFETLGMPEGSADAIRYFSQGIDIALGAIADAERSGESSFIYLYTAHPDKHMHALGVEHEEVGKVVRGLESEVERFWEVLGDREALLSGQYRDVATKGKCATKCGGPSAIDAAVVVTADHGHITVHEGDMIQLPNDVLDLLEYACIGVHGKGRHAYLHCRAGLQDHLVRVWLSIVELTENFLLLTVEEAIDNGLFGPGCMRLKVRPRLGDFVAISIGKKTLVTPTDVERYRNPCLCQGAHGSLLAEEMNIPFIFLQPSSRE